MHGTRHRRGRLRGLGFLAVAAIGSITAFGTVTAANAAPASPFDLTSATLRPATGTPRPASGTQASLWSNNSIATTVVDGSGQVQIGAIGDFCKDWPRIRVTVDGNVVGTTQIVDAKRYGTYPLRATFTPGRHTVAVQFVNDFRDDSCDRNVHLASVRMSTPGTSAPVAASGSVPTSAVPSPASPTSSATTRPSASSSGTTRPSAPAPTTSSAGPSAPAEVPEEPIRSSPTPKPITSPSSKVPSSAPGPGTTGVPAGKALKRHDGDLNVTVDGTVVDGLDIHGFLNIKASNVTVRNTRIRGREPGTTLKALVAAYGDHRNFVIEDSTLQSDFITPYMDGIKGRNFTARRLDVSNVVDTALVFGDNVVIADSWFHGTKNFSPWAKQPDNQTHNDNLEIVGGNNIEVRNNTFEGASDQAIMITQDYSRSSNIRIRDNFMTAGKCIVNLSEKGKGPITSSLTGNRFGPSGIPNCAVIAAASSMPAMKDNLWLGTTDQIQVRSRSA